MNALMAADGAKLETVKLPPANRARYAGEPLSRAAAGAIVLRIWAAIYLPALGSAEIKGEEIRRDHAGDFDAGERRLDRAAL